MIELEPPPIARVLRSSRHLVPIREGSDELPPLVCIPGAAANVCCFLGLARAIGNGRSVYGLQARGLAGGESTHESVEAAARDYVREIRSVWPTGPYRLVGHSFGGWVAFEMALRLQSLRARAALVLIDSAAPSKRGIVGRRLDSHDALLELARRIEQGCGRPLGLNRPASNGREPEEMLELLTDRLVTERILPAPSAGRFLRAMHRQFLAQVNMAYEPGGEFRGPVLLVHAALERDRSSGGGGSGRTSRTHAWRAHAPGLTTREVPGDHMSILAEPHVRALACVLEGDGSDGAGR